MDNELKIGDTVFSESRYHGYGIRKVERFTNTTIILDDGTKIRKPLENGSTAIGTSGYGNIYYYPFSYERLTAYNRQESLRFLQKFKFEKLNNDQIHFLVENLKSY